MQCDTDSQTALRLLLHPRDALRVKAPLDLGACLAVNDKTVLSGLVIFNSNISDIQNGIRQIDVRHLVAAVKS